MKKPNCLISLSEEELGRIKLPSDEDIKNALEKGRKEAEALLKNSCCGLRNNACFKR